MEKILIIEDDKNIRETVEELLLYKNYEVVKASNGKKGIMLACSELPDLILCDIMMPETNGYKVLETVRKNTDLYNKPFIFLTAKADIKDLRKGMNLGADDYIIKPFDPKELIEAVEIRLNLANKAAKAVDNKVNKLLEDLNNASSHEFNTSLNGILGFSDILISDNSRFNPDKVQMYAQIIKNSGLRLKNALNNLLLYKELKALIYDNTKIKYYQGTTLIVNCFTEKTIETIAEKYNRSRDFTCNIEKARIQLPSELCKKILNELIDNAFKFSKPGSKVSVIGKINKKNYSLKIRDEGRGFTDKQIKDIGPFKQFDLEKYEQQGNGLGLFIAKKIIKLNEGKLKINSIYNKYTEIDIELKIV